MTQTDDQLSRPASSFLPATAVLEMTYRCNHQCLFCSCPWYDAAGDFDIRQEMTTQQWIDLIERFCTMGVSSLAFTGGEPLLKEGIEEILTCAAHCQTEHIETENARLVSRFAPPKLYLLSNGHVMSDRILEQCKEHNIHLSLSLPGLRTFAHHTDGGDVDNVLGWFRRAKELGVGTTVGVTVTRQNIGELYETLSHAFIAGADNLLMNRFLPGGRGLLHQDELMLTREQIPEMLDIAEAVLNEANRVGHLGTELPKCTFEADRYKRLTVSSRCSAGRDFFVVDPSGYVRVCNHSPKRLAHVERLNELKQDPYWKQFNQKDYLPDQCGDCQLLLQCDGGCREAAHILTGCVKGLDPALDEQRASFNSTTSR